VRTFVVENPPPHYGGLYWIFVKLTTDSGIGVELNEEVAESHPYTGKHLHLEMQNEPAR
jgi:hypothetical protein